MKTKKDKPTRHEVTCVRCDFTKSWTQTIWNRHMWLVHGIRNEIRIGTDPRNDKEKSLFPSLV